MSTASLQLSPSFIGTKAFFGLNTLENDTSADYPRFASYTGWTSGTNDELEGITLDNQGGFWLASEERIDSTFPRALYHVNAKGDIQAEIGLPAKLPSVENG